MLIMAQIKKRQCHQTEESNIPNNVWNTKACASLLWGGEGSIFIFNTHQILIIIMSISLQMQTLPILTESNMVKGH